MTDLSTLTDTELNERLLLVQGWKRTETHPGYWTNPGIPKSKYWTAAELPSFVDSLDALKSGPEKMLREAGWRIEVFQRGIEISYEAIWIHVDDDGKTQYIYGRAHTEERARAEAVCQGLESLRVMEEQR